MVIEFLTFRVAPDDQEGWRAADERTWTRFLQMQTGFIRKEVWIDPSRADRVHVVIWWEDEKCWTSIPPAAMKAVDQAMGAWLRPSTMHRFNA